MQDYAVEQHAVLIGLTGKYLKEAAGEYGTDLFINSIVKYARQRGRRMRNRALRDGRPLNYETFLAYGELKFDTLPGDYEVGAASPVFINCCCRCRWNEGWKAYGLSEYGEWYCKYVDLHLVQGFSEDMVMITKTMLGLGDDRCTFVNVGYEQTKESQERIAAVKAELDGRYIRDFVYHMGHWLSAVRAVVRPVLAETYDSVEASVRAAFAGYFGEELAGKVWEASEQDFDLF